MLLRVERYRYRNVILTVKTIDVSCNQNILSDTVLEISTNSVLKEQTV